MAKKMESSALWIKFRTDWYPLSDSDKLEPNQ